MGSPGGSASDSSHTGYEKAPTGRAARSQLYENYENELQSRTIEKRALQEAKIVSENVVTCDQRGECYYRDSRSH